MDIYKEPMLFKHFLTEKECECLINISKNRMTPSSIGRGSSDNVRVSNTAVFDNLKDNIARRITSRISTIFQVPFHELEGLQVTHYETNGFYRPHLDVNLQSDGPLADHRGRYITFIIGLNDDYEGGKTNFINLENKSFRIPKGGILMFRSTDVNNCIDLSSKHEGQRVTKGEKWIATMWGHGPCYLKNSLDDLLKIDLGQTEVKECDN